MDNREWAVTILAQWLLCLVVFSAGEVNMDPVIHFRTRWGDTLLHAAVRARDLEALGAFLELGCPTEAIDREGRTAIWTAAETGEADMMGVLSKYGADINVRYGQFNETLLHVAAKNGRDLAVFWLLDNGLDTEVEDAVGWTPLHTAATFNHKTTVHLLAARGADVNATDINGETPLHKAVRMGRERIVEQLLEVGASVNSTDTEDRTPLYWAKRFKFTKIEGLLLKKLANDG